MSSCERSLQGTETEKSAIGFNLNNYMTFELRRGDEDSAQNDDLTFDVLVDRIESEMIYFRVKFDKPTAVSQGS